METASKMLPESVEALKNLLLSERELSVQKNSELKEKETELKKKDAVGSLAEHQVDCGLC
ncbi:MAG: hypothetical protein RQ936_10160 [Gammaproteobacteria bacterium]|nr:hypothetical protein [Gammaproteobacteria bacterium]